MKHPVSGDHDDQLLRQWLATPDRRDPGFAWRVLTALPPRRPRPRFRLILLVATAVAGGLLSFFGLGGARALTGVVLPAPGDPSSLFLTVVVLLALAAAVLALVSEAAD